MLSNIQEENRKTSFLPSWFRQEVPDISQLKNMKRMFDEQALTTVCENARCPNIGQCWGRGVATFMILGDICTRDCRFCAVKIGRAGAVDALEPARVAQMAERLGLRYVVITSVTRDDLPDQGADQFADTVAALRALKEDVKVELLIPDFSAHPELLARVVKSHPDVLSHNMEMAARLFPSLRPQADYQRSLQVLRMMRNTAPDIFIKSGFMVGLGETDDEVYALMSDIRATGCDMLTVGQYLSPSKGERHVAVDRFVAPEMFAYYKKQALDLGFRHVSSGPLVRSSYIAESGYENCLQH